MNLTSLQRSIQFVEAAIAAEPERYEARLECAQLLRTAGFRSRALKELRLAAELGAPFELVGYHRAILEYQLGSARTAASYLRGRYGADPTASDHFRDVFELYAADAGASDEADAQLEATTLAPETGLLLLDTHLKAREFERIKRTIDRCGLNHARYPRARSLHRLAKLENHLQAGSWDLSSAIELAMLYKAERRSEDGAAILADYEIVTVDDEQMLANAVGRLSELGNDLIAAKHSHDFLLRHPASSVARRLLIRLAQALGDAECVQSVASVDTIMDDVLQAQEALIAYTRTGGRRLAEVPYERLLTGMKDVLTTVTDDTASPGRLSELRMAAYLIRPEDQTALIGIDARHADALRSFKHTRQVPQNASLACLKELTVSVMAPVAARGGTSFPAAELATSCRQGDHPGVDMRTRAADEIALVSPSAGPFRPAGPEALIGDAVDGWSHLDFSNTFETRDVRLAHLHGAALIGRGLLINRAGQAVVDVQNDAIRRNFPLANLRSVKSNWLKKAQLQLSADASGFKYAGALSDHTSIIEDSCYLLDNGQGYNFANWHMYVFPRLYAYFSAGLHEAGVKLLIYKGTSSRLIDMLKGFGISGDQLLVHDPQTSSVFLSLFVPTAMSDVEKLLAPQAFRVFDRLTVESLHRSGYPVASRWPDGTAPTKVYLSRADVPRRKLINEARIENIARDCGWEVILPAELSLTDAVHLYRNVDCICGPSGSSFLNMLLMKKGAKSIMISHPRYSATAYLCCQFGALREISVAIVFGRVESGESIVGHQEAFSVPEDHVARLLAAA